MSNTQKLNYKGIEIFQMDFSKLNDIEDIKNLIKESAGHIRSQPTNSVYTLTNIHGMHFSSEIKELFKEFIKNNKPYVKAGAVVGLNGLQTILYNGLMKLTGRDIKSLGTTNEAKEWLFTQN